MKVYQFSKKNSENSLRDTHYIAGKSKSISKKIAIDIYGKITDLYQMEGYEGYNSDNLPDFIINADLYFSHLK